ncbi:glutaredoxin family protein [Metabacillus halosaccharovorans]|uniref:glutaredoxin family protein n=1 Tax=Metabacillus TaxID=2675233 RepID=UPI000C80F58E|nr:MULTISPECIES: glutaredoxin family protein [Metabacillus]MCM3443364.1 glutaredoxin family protein [Metabacillus halosaccharovorans]PMC34927.1 NrdH-redoxin [Bacillus sp. UMB0899]
MENQKVEIYTTKTCPDCKAAKEFLSSHSISYIENDIEDDSKNMDNLIALTGKHIVPTIKFGDEVFIGFSINREKIESLLT